MLTFLAATAVALTHPVEGDFAFVDVDVVDVEQGAIIADRTVVVRDNRIVAILEPNENLPEGIELIEGEGLYLAPGLADMHVHLSQPEQLQLFLGYGITTIRIMWGDDRTLALREKVNAGELPGPRIITAGNILDGSPAFRDTTLELTSKQDAVQAVERQKAAGYDFIKIYGQLDVEVYTAIVEATRSNKIPFAGHVPRAVSIERTITDGLASHEHMGLIWESVLQDAFKPSDFPRAFREIYLGSAELEEVIDFKKLDDLASLMSEEGTAHVPTLALLWKRSIACGEAKQYLQMEEMRFLPPFRRRLWEERLPCSQDNDAPDQSLFWSGAKDFWSAVIKAYFEAGVLIMTGTDTPTTFLLPGLSLHEELELLVEAGLSESSAIQASTLNVGKFLGEDHRVAVGAPASLVLLRANPLIDVRNYREIEGVMVGGQWLDRRELDQMLDRVAVAANNSADHILP